MKNTLLPIFSIGFILTLIVSCSGPKQSQESKDSYKDYKVSMKKLKKDPTNKKYTSWLNTSLEKILVLEESNIYKLKNSEKLKDREKAITLYNKMLAKIDESSSYTKGIFASYSSKFEEERAVLSKSISEEYYQEGLSKLTLFEERELKSNAKDAYHYFTKAKKYDAENMEMDSLINYALVSAQKKYSIEADYPFLRMHSFRIDRILGDLERESDQFISIEYNPIGFSNDADCAIDLDFGRLDVRDSENVDTKNFNKEIISNQDTIEVQGMVTIRNFTRTSTLNIRLNSRGNHNCSVTSQLMNESLREEIEEYTLTGDERAIPSKYKNTKKMKFEDEDDVIEELLRDLYSDIRRAIL